MSDKTEINLPDDCSRFDEDVVINLLGMYFSEFNIPDVKVTTHQLSEIDMVQESVQDETDWTEEEYNAHIMVSESIKGSECILYMESDTYTTQSLFREFKTYIDRTMSNIMVVNNNNWDSLEVQPRPEGGLFDMFG